MPIIVVILILVVVLTLIPWDPVNAAVRNRVVYAVALIALIWLLLILFGVVHVPSGNIWR